MDANVGQENPIGSLSSKLSAAHDLLIKSSKIASIIGAFCGFVYLLSYTTHVGIPFPLELSVLPTTLLIVGLTSIVGTFIIIAGMFMPALTLDYNDEVTKGYRRADDLQNNVVKARFNRYFLCTWVPTACALIGLILLLGIIGEEIWLKSFGAIAIFISASWIFYTPKYVEVFLENRMQYLFINSLQILFSASAYLLIIIIMISVFPDLGNLPAWSGCLVALAIFTLCQIAIFVPPTKRRGDEILPSITPGEKAPPVMQAVFFVAVIFTALTVLMPQVNYKIGGAALRAFHVGGDVPVTICLKTKPPAMILKRFVFDPDYCSEKLSMKLDSGDRVYVSKFISKKESDEQQNISKSGAIYFRQDEIRQKIYFRTVEVNR